ncbi:MAG: sigma-70 family RNA polymerase sigma factor [Chitinophagales bacterium]|mgnify:FL=1|jgi:RNA polymerase primary sigma factor|nr:sigma-70 family RNA polymerase sigma factor [Chitinophagales bacterium]
MKEFKISTLITSRESHVLDRYFNEISRIKLLSVEQEAVLFERIKKGDEKALEQIIKANLRFVVSVAKSYQNQGMSLNDLINEGNLGLMKAARRFDATRGFKFISYAVWWIRQSILQAMSEQGRSIRLPINRANEYAQVQKALADYLQKHQIQPSIEELATITGLNEQNISEAIVDYRPLSLDAPINGGDDTSESHANTLVDENMLPDYDLHRESLRNQIQQAIQTLTKREADILGYFYGLNGKPAIPIEIIAEQMSLSVERVRQIKEQAIKRLRRNSISNSLKIYL